MEFLKGSKRKPRLSLGRRFRELKIHSYSILGVNYGYYQYKKENQKTKKVRD